MTQTTIEIPSHYEVRCAREIPHLDGTLYDLVHQDTRARHVHLAVSDRNNYFCALYRTPPDDSTGVPHIMEHCVSGGSRRFPPGAGGDMYTRSLITDINGMTSADHTTFYVASRNQRDYMNWLEYIVDVTLFPRMERDTFLRQRGHFEFATPDDPASGLRFTGTVYNEMKAVFGAPNRHIFAALNRALFDGHAYANSSGGDPAVMPDLTYEGTVAFFERFYHPGNATFVSRGNIALGEILAKVEEVVEGNRDRRGPTVIPDVPRLDAPVSVEAPIPAAGSRGHVVIGWVAATQAGDSYERLLLDVAGDVLFDGDASPVRRAIRESGLARGAIDTTRAPYRNPLLAVTVADLDPADAEKAEHVVLDAIAAAVRDGLDPDAVDDAIARLELRRRDPANGIGVFLDTVFPPLLYGGDPYSALELDGDLARLARERAAGRPLEEFLTKHLVDNPHRARVALHPDADLERRTVETETAWWADETAKLTDEERDEILALTERLAKPPADEYPHRGLEPEDGLTLLQTPEAHTASVGGVPLDVFLQPAAGITHLWLRIDVSDVADGDVPYLGLLADAIRRDIERATSRVAGLDVRLHTRVRAGSDQTLAWLEIGGRTLTRDQHELAAMIARAVDPTPPDDLERLAAERASALEAGIMNNAQVHLRRLAGAALRRSSAIDDAVRGLGQLRFLKQLDHARAGERVAALAERVRTHDRLAVCVAGSDAGPLLGPLDAVLASVPDRPRDPHPALTDRIEPPYPHAARIAQLPVAFTCEAHAIPGLDHPDVPAIGVLTQLMFSGYLNAEIRRGGAYGVDFEVLPERGLWWISSRRDPLPANTYRAFTEALDRFRNDTWDASTAKDGMLAILRVTDPVETPASSARRAWLGSYTGHTTDLWNAFRQRILGVRDKDLRRVAADYFAHPSRATLVGRTMLDGSPEVSALFDHVEDV